MKKKYSLLIAALAILTTVGLGGVALAWGGPGGQFWKQDPEAAAQRWQEQMSEQANILGISPDDYKTAWAEGKNFWEIAKEKGISETDLQAKMQAQRQAQQKEWLQNLVDQGLISQSQADERLEQMQSRVESMPHGAMMMKHGHGDFMGGHF